MSKDRRLTEGWKSADHDGYEECPKFLYRTFYVYDEFIFTFVVRNDEKGFQVRFYRTTMEELKKSGEWYIVALFKDLLGAKILPRFKEVEEYIKETMEKSTRAATETMKEKRGADFEKERIKVEFDELYEKFKGE